MPTQDNAPLSDKAQEAIERAERRAEERRLKHQADDADRKVAAAKKKKTSKKAPSSKKPADPVEPQKAEVSPELASFMSKPDEAHIESRAEAATAAFTLMEEMKAASEEAKVEVVKDDMYYLECHQCGGPGIWMYKSAGMLGPDDWAASYKPRGVIWPSKEIWCQCCMQYGGGSETALKVLSHTSNGGRLEGVAAYDRMVRTISRKEYNRLIGQAVEDVPADAVTSK